MAYVKAAQGKTAGSSEPQFPPRMLEMLTSYLRHTKCAWDFMDYWDKAKGYRPPVDIRKENGLDVLDSLDDLDMQAFLGHVRRALNRGYLQ